MTDQNRKTLRSFYCRDYLWEHFEQMAQELGCSMDYLINESMRLYARSREYPAGAEMNDAGFGQAVPTTRQDRFDGGFNAGQGGGMNQRGFDRVPVGQPASTGQRPMPPSPAGRSNPQGFQRAGSPPPPPRPTPPSPGSDWQNSGPPSPPQPPQPPSPPQAPPSQGYGGSPGYGAAPGRQTLYLSFNNNRYAIDKDQFVIGRGSDKTDLTIRDGNISRKHCAVVFRNGSYYIKDLGSTNGVEYRGNRIESKKIEEGDHFFLCDYELRFSYRG